MLTDVIRMAFLIFIIIPAVVGFAVGLTLRFLLFKKSRYKESTKNTVGWFLILGLPIIFPILLIVTNSFYNKREHARLRELEVEYQNKNLDVFKITDIETQNNNIILKFLVPRDGKYNIMLKAFQNNKKFILLNTYPVSGLPMKSGFNSVTVPIDNNSIILNQPVDVSFQIENDDRSYALIHADYPSFYEGVCFYSPNIANMDPCAYSAIARDEDSRLHLDPEL